MGACVDNVYVLAGSHLTLANHLALDQSAVDALASMPLQALQGFVVNLSLAEVCRPHTTHTHIHIHTHAYIRCIYAHTEEIKIENKTCVLWQRGLDLIDGRLPFEIDDHEAAKTVHIELI